MNKCVNCNDEEGTVTIKCPDGRNVKVGPKCYDNAMRTSDWTMLNKDEDKAK